MHRISLNGGCADMQVQETTLDWLVGLAAATALHLGPVILPLKSQINRVLKALFAAPSKVTPFPPAPLPMASQTNRNVYPLPTFHFEQECLTRTGLTELPGLAALLATQ